MQLRRREALGRTILVCLSITLPLFLHGFAIAQQGGREGQDITGEVPEEVAKFYRRFLDLYLDNYERVSDLKTMRDAGAPEEARAEIIETLKDSEGTIETLRDLFQSAKEKEASVSILKSMRKTLEIYPIYLDKVINDWEPSKKQVLKRRRMSDNKIIRLNPELATPSLLRGVFLGQLVSNVQSIPSLSEWFQQRFSKLDDWISSKYEKIFPLYLKLLSRVNRVYRSDDAGEEERTDVLQEVRNEWQRFWQDMDEDSDWQNMRSTVRRLRALFRDRGDRLPGAQNRINERVTNLQKQIGDLYQLYVEHPFVNQENRLRMILRLSKAFVNRAGKVGNGQAARDLSGTAIQFVTDMHHRQPQKFWSADDLEELEQKKEQELEELSATFADLSLKNYKTAPERYNFPFKSVLQLVQRLGTNYGKKEQEIANRVRDVAQFVTSRYELSTQGINLMQAYQNALQEREFSNPPEFVQFEEAFRAEYETELKQLMGHVNRIQNMRDNLDDMIEKVRNVDPDKRAATFASTTNSQQQ